MYTVARLLKNQIVVFLFFFSLPLAASQELLPVYLTWQKDPSTTMTIHWTTYLAKAESRQQFLRVDISTTKRTFTAITEKGEVIDYYEQPAK
jgi:hypothetical protein